METMSWAVRVGMGEECSRAVDGGAACERSGPVAETEMGGLDGWRLAGLRADGGEQVERVGAVVALRQSASRPHCRLRDI